ncbi:MAG: winged helix-turn-helix domain-containing protein [Marinifilaceae bacterium]|jgi:DNA-binding transcriptional ArsR family regulator
MTEPITDKHKRTARYAKALSHPVRIYILEYLSKQACCYSGDLSEILPIAKSTLSQHLKELKEVGIIQGETNPPKIKYCVNKKNLEEARLLLRTIFE